MPTSVVYSIVDFSSAGWLVVAAGDPSMTRFPPHERIEYATVDRSPAIDNYHARNAPTLSEPIGVSLVPPFLASAEPQQLEPIGIRDCYLDEFIYRSLSEK